MSDSRIVDALLAAANVPRSTRFKLAAIALGTVVFVVLVPALLLSLTNLAERNLIDPHWRLIEQIIALVCVLAGLLLTLWTLITQVYSGKGTPVPLVPTQKLIASGPYRLCRNPIQLGMTSYYLGVGAWFGSLRTGVLMFLVMTILGSCYHKLVEERELSRRFGQEYEEYRKRTPFLFPRIWD